MDRAEYSKIINQGPYYSTVPFIAQHNTFTALQVQFLQTLRTFILQTGKAEKEHLIAPPFTNLHPQGIRGLFLPNQIQEILTFVDELGEKVA